MASTKNSDLHETVTGLRLEDERQTAQPLRTDDARTLLFMCLDVKRNLFAPAADAMRWRSPNRAGKLVRLTYTCPVDTAELIALAQYWAYRAGGYVLLNLVDDPAWLALIFC
jgi:hypothetical protein